MVVAAVVAGDAVALGVGEALVFGDAEAIGLGVGDADFLVAPLAANGREQATAAVHAVMRYNLVFIGWIVLEIPL